MVEDKLWQQADQQVERWREHGEDALAIWDSSEWEKPESLASEDLCAVRSSKAKRLTHIKPGYYNPPGRPIFVPGLHWLAVIMVSRSAQLDPPVLAAMRWWSGRGAHASFKRDEEGKLLVERLLVWGRSVVHIFDQGFASAFWLGVLLAFGLRFVLGFRADYQLFDAQGNRAPRLAHRHRQAWVVGAHHLGQSPRPVGSSQRARSAGDASRSSRHAAVARGLPRASDALPGIS